ncbi:hemerythrin domain-containing protein [Lutibacter sp. A64]|uniref:hemerythrin domain-containing protein n=1 Tax=Lutibacter sp. A64 TaxID=2918526 RepID=UPI001F06791B|nr:hemerythrin domain-containing protein [Lutibacter sp. A64]UMB52374.1 hemerythrin domain-containing protein [Lutibacter sp. A64]
MAIKRHQSLQEFSKDHHQALLLCWKIKVGLSKKVEVDRIKTYVNWFYETHILEHFQLEERYMFPVLGGEHPLIIQALEEHNLIIALFINTTEIENSLTRLHVKLKEHVRFEERILFNEIQAVATKEQLEDIEKFHNETKFVDNLNDVFWK